MFNRVDSPSRGTNGMGTSTGSCHRLYLIDLIYTLLSAKRKIMAMPSHLPAGGGQGRSELHRGVHKLPARMVRVSTGSVQTKGGFTISSVQRSIRGIEKRR
ncbi:hypothetical protein VTN49DRAFT_5519 [Thermomyces lanuginosus]|uniref:uncharacterized protein n=1 Tax=Thermomyces lanuginosus TaxID=5541 RepID=UPI0037430799